MPILYQYIILLSLQNPRCSVFVWLGSNRNNYYLYLICGAFFTVIFASSQSDKNQVDIII